MASMTKMVFNSQTKTVSSTAYLELKKEEDGFIRFNIASGFTDETEILFENENILMRVNARGELAFFDSENQPLASVTVPAGDEGRGCYMDLSCKAEDDAILVRFPAYSWYDNYPHCDGESDRWDAEIIGYKTPIRFCLSSKTVQG